MPAEVKRATPGEIDVAYAIVCEYYDAARVVARDSREEFLAGYFAAAAGVWLAWDSGRVAGCIALRALERHGAAEIKRMYVRPTWRGRGIAQQLLQNAERFAADAGYRWIYLDTTDEMKAASRLYEEHGYQRCERYNNNPQATIFMRKRLANPVQT